MSVIVRGVSKRMGKNDVLRNVSIEVDPGTVVGLQGINGSGKTMLMVVTGMLFAGMNLKKIFTNKRVYFVSFLRLVIVPVIALILIKCSQLSTFSSNGNKLMLIVFLAIITPSASTVTQMCQVYGNDSQYASAINVVTTLFAIVSMPAMVILFQMIV